MTFSFIRAEFLCGFLLFVTVSFAHVLSWQLSRLYHRACMA